MKLAPASVAILLAAASNAQLPVYNDHTADFEKLTQGVKALPRAGVPGNVVAGGPDAFCIVAGAAGRTTVPVVAAARHGRGLALAFGHGSYLEKSGLSQGDTLQLVKNAVVFTKLQQRATRVAVYRSPQLAKALIDSGIQASEFTGVNWTKDLAFYDAVLSANDTLGNIGDLQAIAAYVQRGGVFVGAVCGWGWQQINGPRGQTLAVNNHHNFVLLRMGLVYGRATVSALAPVSPAILKTTNCQYAMLQLIAQRDRTAQLTPQQLEQFTGLIVDAVENIHPFDTIVRNPLDAIILQIGSTLVPTEGKPLTSAEPLKRLAMRVRHIDSSGISEVEVTPDPAARVFPGLAPSDAPRLPRDVTINGNVSGWASTGMWVNAGDRVTVTVPEAVKGKGLLVRIGAHSDKLWNLAAWKRHPDVTRTFPVTQTVTKAKNEFGGLVYIVVPNAAGLGHFQIKIEGAVRAPRFILGETSTTYWTATERNQPAPWAELETGKIILTVPSAVVRGLDDPEGLMSQWNRVMDLYAELGRRPLGVTPQRMVCDVQISAGYMHSGYPIMMHMDQPANLVSIHTQPRGKPNNWGFWHELGHNHQVADWTFGGTGEVTCNLFSMYVLEKLNGVPPKDSFDFKPERLTKYIQDGAKFTEWQAEPFLALTMYRQLVEGFGWQPLQKVFEEYAALKPADRPRTDDQKRDQWMVRLSNATGRNLTAFFRKWGVPVSQAAQDSVASLPTWMHPDLR